MELSETDPTNTTEIELRVNVESTQPNIQPSSTPVDSPVERVLKDMSEEQWGCFQYFIVSISFFSPLILISFWFISLAIIQKTPSVTTISGSIGTPGYIYYMNVTVAIIIIFLAAWTTFLRNVQIRVIFDRFPEYNIKHEDMEDGTVEYADYVCTCCYHCNSNRCGGPILHNKETHGHRVSGCKYYCTTIRGFNVIATVVGILSWIGFLCIYIFDIYEWPKTHLMVTGMTVGGILFFQFTHSSILLRQRQAEYKLLDVNERNCKTMCYYLDVIFAFFIPFYALFMYLVHIASASYLQRFLAGGAEAPDGTNYQFQWMSVPGLVFYYMLFAYLFYKDNFRDELERYASFKFGYCFL